MTRPGGRIVTKVVAVLAASVGLLAMVGVGPAAAATPTTVSPTCKRRLRWLHRNLDPALAHRQLGYGRSSSRSLRPELEAGSSPGSIGCPGKQGHLYVTHTYPTAISASGQMTVSWADGSEPNTGQHKRRLPWHLQQDVR